MHGHYFLINFIGMGILGSTLTVEYNLCGKVSADDCDSKLAAGVRLN